MNDIDAIHNDYNVFDKPKEALDWVDKELRRIRSIPPLAVGEDVILHRLWRDGDKAAGDRLVNSRLPQALSFARKRYSKEGHRDPMRLMELYSAGCLALVEARETFDPDQGCSFKTYVWKILDRFILQEAIHLSNVTTPEAKHIKIGKQSPNYRHINVGQMEDDLGTHASEEPRDNAEEIENLYRWVLNEAIAETVLDGRELLIYMARRRRPKPTHKRLGFELGISGERVRQIDKLSIEKVESACGTKIDDKHLCLAMAKFYASFHFITAKSFDRMLDDEHDNKRFPDAKERHRIWAHRAADKLLAQACDAVLNRVRASDLRGIPPKTVVDLQKKIVAELMMEIDAFVASRPDLQIPPRDNVIPFRRKPTCLIDLEACA